jgi:hypothetical protein
MLFEMDPSPEYVGLLGKFRVDQFYLCNNYQCQLWSYRLITYYTQKEHPTSHTVGSPCWLQTKSIFPYCFSVLDLIPTPAPTTSDKPQTPLCQITSSPSQPRIDMLHYTPLGPFRPCSHPSTITSITPQSPIQISPKPECSSSQPPLPISDEGINPIQNLSATSPVPPTSTWTIKNEPNSFCDEFLMKSWEVQTAKDPTTTSSNQDPITPIFMISTAIPHTDVPPTSIPSLQTSTNMASNDDNYISMMVLTRLRVLRKESEES